MTTHPYTRLFPGNAVAPTVSDDSSLGFEVGDVWIDEVGGAAYTALSVAVGAAVWQAPGAGGGAVDSVFGRTGVVVAVAGDYDASLITNTPAGDITAITTQAAINELDTEKSPTGHTHALTLDDVYELDGLLATMGDADFIQWNEATGKFEGVPAASLVPPFRFQQGFLYGGVLSNNVTDPTNDIDVSWCYARSDTDGANIDTGGALTKKLDANFATGNNQGMLDTGSVGNGTYHIFAIVGGGNGDILASLSPTTPALPGGYTQQRRIGSIVRVGGVILPFTQVGDYFELKTPVVDVNVSDLGTSSTTYTLPSVPTGIALRANLTGFTWKVANYAAVYARSLAQADVAAAYNTTANIYDVSGGAGASSNLVVWTDTSAQIAARSNVASTNLIIITRGWIDTRGR